MKPHMLDRHRQYLDPALLRDGPVLEQMRARAATFVHRHLTGDEAELVLNMLGLGGHDNGDD